MKIHVISILLLHLHDFVFTEEVLSKAQVSDGLNIKLINDTIYDALKKTEFFDNVIRIASWNLYDAPGSTQWNDNRGEVCQFLGRITPMVCI